MSFHTSNNFNSAPKLINDRKITKKRQQRNRLCLCTFFWVQMRTSLPRSKNGVWRSGELAQRCFITWVHKSFSQWQHPKQSILKGLPPQKGPRLTLSLAAGRGLLSVCLTFNCVWTVNWMKLLLNLIYQNPAHVPFRKISDCCFANESDLPIYPLAAICSSVCLDVRAFANDPWISVSIWIVFLFSLDFWAMKSCFYSAPHKNIHTEWMPARDTGRVYNIYIWQIQFQVHTQPIPYYMPSYSIPSQVAWRWWWCPRANLEVSQSFVQNFSMGDRKSVV